MNSMNSKLIDDVIADAKAAAEDVNALAVDLRLGAQLRWRLFRAELEVFKLGLKRLGLLLPLLLLTVLLSSMTLSILLGYLVFLATDSPLLGLVSVCAVQLAGMLWLGTRALATVRAMNFRGSRAHLLRLSRYVAE